MIPASAVFDQSTLSALLDLDPLVQEYRAFFASLDWSVLDREPAARSSRGRPAHPESAYLKACLLRIREGLSYATEVRDFLRTHPLLVIELGFRLALDPSQPYGFDVERTLPTRFWLSEKLRYLDQDLLQALLQATVHALQDAIPGLGETVAFDVKHIYAWVKENNERAYAPNAMIKRAARSATPIVSSASNARPIRSSPMARPKSRKNTCGATAPALPRRPLPTTAMSCWPNTLSPSTKAM